MQAEPLVAQRATTEEPEQHCALTYPADISSDAASIDCGTAWCGTFSVPRYLAALDSKVLGRVLLTAAATASTQTVVQENVAKLPDGLVFVADKQLGGKGAILEVGLWPQPPAAAGEAAMGNSEGSGTNPCLLARRWADCADLFAHSPALLIK